MKLTTLAPRGLLFAAALLGTTALSQPMVFMDAAGGKTVEDLEAERDALIQEAEEIERAAGDGDLSDDDLATITATADKVKRISALIDAKKTMAPRATGRRTAPEPGAGRERVAAPAKITDQKGGFKSLGDFANSVRLAGGQHQNLEAQNRLQNALTSYGNEGNGADGGFLVPPDFRREVAVKVMGEDSLLSRTDRMTTGSNSIVLPKDEATPYGTSGIQAYWLDEAGQKPQSKPVFGANTLRLNKLAALVPMTDEMLEDAPFVDSYLRSKVPQVMNASINTAIVRGNGVGKPLGILNSGSLISVAKESGQTADTILYANIVNMYSRMRAGSLPNSVWLINQSIMPQLLLMAFDPAATAGKVPIFMPATGAAGAPYGTLFGRPILPIEATSALGDKGDIIFVDLSSYVSVTKGQDIKTDVSIHLYFDYDVSTYRFVFRVTGQPWWNSAVTPQASGAPTLGQFITLDERA